MDSKSVIFLFISAAIVLIASGEDALPPPPEALDKETLTQPQTSGALNEDQIQQPRNSHGSNLAEYNETCALSGESGLQCNTYKSLFCESRICKCKPAATENGPRYVYSDIEETCLEVSSIRNGYTCSGNVQCQESTLGKYSQCHPVDKKCVCYDTDGQNRETTKVNEICYIKKRIDDRCTSDIECEAGIKGSVCLGLEQVRADGRYGICQCKGGHILDPRLNECLQLGRINSTCKSDLQCKHLEALGKLSLCSENSKRCECWDTGYDGKTETGYYKGKCHYVRYANQTCESREECVLGAGENAICETHPSYNNQKMCQCKLGFTCGGTGLQIALSTIFMSLTAIFLKQF